MSETLSVSVSIEPLLEKSSQMNLHPQISCVSRGSMFLLASVLSFFSVFQLTDLGSCYCSGVPISPIVTVVPLRGIRSTASTY